jgi:hypothetical protein
MNERPIPEDFPRPPTIAVLSGVHPKVAVRREAQSGIYVAGASDDELRERYEICQDLVTQLVAKCQKNRSTKYASLSETAILAGLFEQLTKSGWGSREEMAWIVRHTASTLAWQGLETAEHLLRSSDERRACRASPM